MLTTAAIVGMALGAGHADERGESVRAVCLKFASWGFVTAGLVVAYAAGTA